MVSLEAAWWRSGEDLPRRTWIGDDPGAAMPKRRSPNRFTGLRMLLFAARFR
jgi:hypothetical protein